MKFDSAANVIEIGTDDFATYANQEATIQLKAVSKKYDVASDTLFLRIKFLGNDPNQDSAAVTSNLEDLIKITQSQIPTFSEE